MFGVVLALLITPFLVATAIMVWSRRRSPPSVLVYAPPLLALVLGVYLWRTVVVNGPVLLPISWLPVLNITANLRLDQFGVFFVMLIGFIGTAVVHYSRFYFVDAKRPQATYWFHLFSFMGSMLGIVVSDSLILLFLFWELTTVTSALLIAHDPKNQKSVRGAVQAFLVTGFGGLCLLAGIILLGQIAGTYNLSALEASRGTVLSHKHHQIALLLIMLGAFAKSAQWPMHFWLPGAMAAPAPISAYLHSATMIKAGIFMIARMVPIFSGAWLWQPLLSTVGCITFLLASWKAFRAMDLKELLAYSTVAYLGMLTTMYAYAPIAGLPGQMLLIANHAFYKSALFLLLGWFEKVSGSRTIMTLYDQHWWPRQRVGTILFSIAGLAMVGGPFMLGYYSKELFTVAVIEGDYAPKVISFLSFVSGVLTVGVALKMIAPTFFGTKTPQEKSHPSVWLLIVPAILLLPQVLGGLALSGTVSPVKVWEIWGRASEFSRIEGTGFTAVVKLLTFALGIVVFGFWRKVAQIPPVTPISEFAGRLVRMILRMCIRFGYAVQGGGYPRYLLVTLLSALVVAGSVFISMAPPQVWMQGMYETDAMIALVPMLVSLAAIIHVFFAHRRTIILLLVAVTGFNLVLFYVIFRAPDVAMAQVLAETVSLILILLAFSIMPRFTRDDRSRTQKILHGIFAGFAGTAVALFTLVSGSVVPGVRAGDALLERSLPEAMGRNVVNVTLVDFRAADTLGEIAVLVIATIGVISMLQFATKASKTFAAIPQGAGSVKSDIMALLARFAVPVAVTFSAYMFFRGHNAPGGGFIAGLIMAAALVLYARARGFDEVETKTVRLSYYALWGGVVIAAVCALVPVFVGLPLLTQFHRSFAQFVPPLSTTLIFDLGVLLAVVGTASLMMNSFARGGLRE